METNSSSAECYTRLEDLELLCLDLSLQLSELLESAGDVMLDDVGSAKKADTFLWPDIFKKWEQCNSTLKSIMNDVSRIQKTMEAVRESLTGIIQTWRVGNLWRSVVSSYNGALYMLEQFILLVYKHVSLQWGRDFRGLPLSAVLMDALSTYNEAFKFLSHSETVFHLQPVIISGKCDLLSRFAPKWDCRESRLRNLQINGTSGRPSTACFNLSRMLATVAAKRAQGAVLAMTWSLSPFMQCQTVVDLDSFALLLKECDNFVGIKRGTSEFPPVDSSDRLSLLDQTADVVEFLPLKDFLKEEQESLDAFLDEIAGVSNSFLLQRAGKNGEARVSRYRKLSIWLHYVEQLWKQVSYSVDETLMWDTRWSGYHLPLGTKETAFVKHLSSVFTVVQKHIESLLPDGPKTDVRCSREISAKKLSDMTETEIERGRSVIRTLKSLKDSIEMVSLWRELDELIVDSQLVHHRLGTEVESASSHHILPGEKGIQFFNSGMFDPGVPLKEEHLPRLYLQLRALTTVCEVYSYSVEGNLWDSLTAWNIVKYLDVSQNSLPLNSEKLITINPIEKLDRKALLATESVNAAILVFSLETLETHFKSVIKDLARTSENSFTMFVQSCDRICLASSDELMPKGNFWRKQHRAPRGASDYVPPLVVAVLEPVIDGVKNLTDASQSLIGQEIVKAVCHAMLETILKYELKFNFFGAMQLQQDFVCIKTWIHNHPVLSDVAKDEIVDNDVFLECEGVTRLLMRQRDWFNSVAVGRNQVGPSSRRNSRPNADNIPPEMYVIHQHLWLGLRVSSDHCLGPFCS